MAEILTIIAPVFLIMMLGYGLGKTELFPENASGVLITFVWYVAIPALMLRSLAPNDLPDANELLLVGSYYGALYLVYGATYFSSRRLFGLNQAEGGIFALSTCFANGAFLGIPIIEGVYGEEGVRLLLILLSFHSLTLLPITTVIVETAQGKSSEGSVAGRILSSIWHNPII
ncbi:MAG: AEC family transporter, partial [Kordiimonadaceae bacterium]|nr:AEC family transporter [Kordiimonadaceae bacterium]